MVEKEEKSSIIINFNYNETDILELTICTGPELESAIKEIIQQCDQTL